MKTPKKLVQDMVSKNAWSGEGSNFIKYPCPNCKSTDTIHVSGTHYTGVGYVEDRKCKTCKKSYKDGREPDWVKYGR
jgi:transposase-like protein